MKKPRARERDAIVEATAYCFEVNKSCFDQTEQEAISGEDITLQRNYASLMQYIEGGDIFVPDIAIGLLARGVNGLVASEVATVLTYSHRGDVQELCDDFAKVYRAPEFGYSGVKEDDAVHSAILAIQLGGLALNFEEWMPEDLDIGKLVMYAAVHDLDEIITGDIRTLGLSYEELKSKSLLSAGALDAFFAKYGEMQRIAAALSEYSTQLDIEAQIVKIHDKAAPTMSHCTNGGKVLRVEYGMLTPYDYITSTEGTSRKIFKAPYSNHPFWLSILCESRARAMRDTFKITIGEARRISTTYARSYGLDIPEDWLVR